MKQSLNNECHLQIGEFCCALNFSDADYAESVRNYFQNFISSKNPDITVEMEIEMHEDDIFVPSTLDASKSIRGNSFDYFTGLLTGNLDLANRKCHIRVNNALLGNPSIRIFEQFLYQLFYSLLENKYHSNIPRRFLIHSCGVVKDGKGYIFTGPSGSGKSTVAQLSSEYDVLNDDMVFIGKDEREYIIEASPFNGYFKSKKNSSAYLEKIFYLVQDTENYIKEVNSPDYIIPIVRELVPPIDILSEKKGESISIMIDFVSRILNEISIFELHFLPNRSFWRCIDEYKAK